ncbi:F-box domain-containing protein [Mycena indigotica]|uniref:F-box domain-containing protein n=1 Tax=Mycena indigotica TaxID=2126181 RepID=A0A8H6SHP6_9AGAR|nr:F-box domain-containing protein [Mycena indigotica]KAF7298542.1 F-box domain-containing protein [Mycena indigotica]
MLIAASPFQEILHTNTVPTDEQCDEIRAYLQSYNSRLDELHTEVARLEKLLSVVMHERDELTDFLASHQALISPMRRIPDDVLCLIFLETLPAHRNTALDAKEGPMLLAGVCSHWRALALSTPKLWSKMHLVIPPQTPQTMDKQDVLVLEMQRWLKRGANAPLDVSAQVSHHYHHLGAPLGSPTDPLPHLSQSGSASIPRYLAPLLSHDIETFRGCGKTMKEVPRRVRRAAKEAFSIPLPTATNILPAPTLPIPEFLRFPLPLITPIATEKKPTDVEG